ncbi:Sorting nexin-30 [Heterocephalus glaber]|uniref:Sorting nexin-30 n=1 Tax=Heterocephalus glaber TaxID=10181 RepID=G5C1I1_HETGA|nr:Sorting nexin-30 [Heterocephalus glaber]
MLLCLHHMLSAGLRAHFGDWMLAWRASRAERRALRGLSVGSWQQKEAAAQTTAGGTPKALLSSGPHSLRDMPLATSSSEEAVGGHSTPSPDLLVALSFGDKDLV